MFIIQLKLYYLHNPIIRRYSGPHKWDNVLRCIFNQTEIPNGQKKVQQGIEGSSSTWCNKKSKNDPVIVHHGQVKSITLDEIEGSYKIATIHVGHPSNFFLGLGGIIWKVWRGFWLWRISGGNSQVMMGLVLRGYCSIYFPFTYLPMIFPSLSKSMMSQGLLSAVPFLSNYLECGRLSEFLLFLFFFVKFLCL